jgi:hypothetical protein
MFEMEKATFYGDEEENAGKMWHVDCLSGCVGTMLRQFKRL